MTNKEVSILLEDIVKNLFEQIGVNEDVTWEMECTSEDNVHSIKIDISGDSVGYLIGPHGKFLNSFEHVLSLMTRRMGTLDEDEKIYIHIDINGYRKEKDDKIVKMALQKADDARVLGEPVDLTPMPAYMRRIVHTTLQDFDDITTESFGEDTERFVRITPVPDENYLNADTSNDDIEE
jgi:spoIIIJ-associated protein